MKIEYVPKGLSRKDTITVIRELQEIEKAEGLITARSVVERARHKSSHLHKFFEWDDTEAARKYREVQARQLICAVYVRDAQSENAVPVRAFCNVLIEAEESDLATRGYVGIQTILGNPSYQAQVLTYARNQLLLWRQKFGHLQEFLGVAEQIDKIAPPAKEKAA